jgi:hypothetical protein
VGKPAQGGRAVDKLASVKTIVAGSRTVTDYRWVAGAIADSGIAITEIFSGGRRGVDQFGERWAREHGVPVRVFKPDWDRRGKAGGPIRNREMIEYVGPAGALVAVWDGQSRGTADVIRQATAAGLRVFTYRIDGQ